MGNTSRRFRLPDIDMDMPGPVCPVQKPKPRESVENFIFHPHFSEDTLNGLYFNNMYLPEEIVLMILSKIPPKHLLKASQVCRKWCNLIKTTAFWADIYSSKTGKKPIKLPWYVYYCYFTSGCFDRNLLQNNSGQLGFNHWSIIKNYGDEFRVEKEPIGTGPVPSDNPDFNGATSCFVTSYFECNKLQEISFENNNLMQFILSKYSPHIYMSEWVASRFDCGATYTMWCKLLGGHEQLIHDDEDSADEPQEYLHESKIQKYMTAGVDWCKQELLVKDYPHGVVRIVFQHEGKDTQFWAGHFGCKMAGAVVKILFDSIEPLPEE